MCNWTGNEFFLLSKTCILWRFQNVYCWGVFDNSMSLVTLNIDVTISFSDNGSFIDLTHLSAFLEPFP